MQLEALWLCSHQKSLRVAPQAARLDRDGEAQKMSEVRRSILFSQCMFDTIDRYRRVGRQRPRWAFLDRSLPSKTDWHTVVAVEVERRRHARKRGLEYSVPLDCSTKIVSPVMDWCNALVFAVRAGSYGQLK